jgi:hypothetical protein
MGEVCRVRNTINANPKMVGNEDADITAGKHFLGSCSSFTQSQAAIHETPPNPLNALGSEQANRSAMWRWLKKSKKINVVAIAPQPFSTRTYFRTTRTPSHVFSA